MAAKEKKKKKKTSHGQLKRMMMIYRSSGEVCATYPCGLWAGVDYAVFARGREISEIFHFSWVIKRVILFQSAS